jgi:hypothetical protein
MNEPISLSDTNLRQRTLNVLWREGYRNVQDLHGITAADLMVLPGFGNNCLADLRKCFEPYGVIIHDYDNPLTIKQVCEWFFNGGESEVWMVESLSEDTGATFDSAQEALEIFANSGLLAEGRA